MCVCVCTVLCTIHRFDQSVITCPSLTHVLETCTHSVVHVRNVFVLSVTEVVYSIAEAEKVDGAGNPVQDGDNSTVAISRVYSTKTTSVGVINLSQGGIKANSRAEYYDIVS